MGGFYIKEGVNAVSIEDFEKYMLAYYRKINRMITIILIGVILEFVSMIAWMYFLL